jgi:hypothetical protein
MMMMMMLVRRSEVRRRGRSQSEGLKGREDEGASGSKHSAPPCLVRLVLPRGPVVDCQEGGQRGGARAPLTLEQSVRFLLLHRRRERQALLTPAENGWERLFNWGESGKDPLSRVSDFLIFIAYRGGRPFSRLQRTDGRGSLECGDKGWEHVVIM